MFSPELMRFIIKYQGKEYLQEKKDEKNDENPNSFHRLTKFAVVPIKVER